MEIKKSVNAIFRNGASWNAPVRTIAAPSPNIVTVELKDPNVVYELFRFVAKAPSSFTLSGERNRAKPQRRMKCRRRSAVPIISPFVLNVQDERDVSDANDAALCIPSDRELQVGCRFVDTRDDSRYFDEGLCAFGRSCRLDIAEPLRARFRELNSRNYLLDLRHGVQLVRPTVLCRLCGGRD